MKKSQAQKKLGLILIIIGILLTVQMFFKPFDLVYNTWGTILVIVGVISLVVSKKVFPGLFMLYLGTIIMLSENHNLTVMDYLFETWPILLVIFGFSIILNGVFKKHKKNDCEFEEVKINSDNETYIDESSILNAKKLDISGSSFKGGKLTVLMGGMEIYLDNVSANQQINLDCSVIMGGIQLHVPNDIKANLLITPIFGGVDDKRKKFVNTDSVNKVLTIKGTLIFGGIEIKN